MEDKYTAYHHTVVGRKFFAKYRQNEPPMKPNRLGGLRPNYELWNSSSVFWDIITGMKISRQVLNSPSWESFMIDDKTTSETISHPTQFFLRNEELPKHITVPRNGELQEEFDAVGDIETVPIVFAFIYGDKFVVSTKRFESLCEKAHVLTEEKVHDFLSYNVDYIVFWRQEDADYVNSLRIEVPMINFSILSHLLIGGFQNLKEKTGALDHRLKTLETKKEAEWRAANKPAKYRPDKYGRNPDDTIDLSTTDQTQIMCFTLEAFFYDNYQSVMELSSLSLCNLDELTDYNIGEKMLQTIFPLFSVHSQYRYVHANGPQLGPLTIVKHPNIHMFRLASVFFKNLRGEFNITEVQRKFGPFKNHHILMSAILDIERCPIGSDEYIANGILFSRNPYLGHYDTFNDMMCDGIVIGRSTHITLDSKFNIKTRDTNIPPYVGMFLTLSFFFDGMAYESPHNTTLSLFEGIDDKDLKMEEFTV